MCCIEYRKREKKVCRMVVERRKEKEKETAEGVQGFLLMTLCRDYIEVVAV